MLYGRIRTPSMYFQAQLQTLILGRTRPTLYKVKSWTFMVGCSRKTCLSMQQGVKMFFFGRISLWPAKNFVAAKMLLSHAPNISGLSVYLALHCGLGERRKSRVISAQSVRGLWQMIWSSPSYPCSVPQLWISEDLVKSRGATKPICLGFAFQIKPSDWTPCLRHWSRLSVCISISVLITFCL